MITPIPKKIEFLNPVTSCFIPVSIINLIEYAKAIFINGAITKSNTQKISSGLNLNTSI